MGAMLVVAMQPSRQLGGRAIGVVVGLSLGPLAQRALDEALGPRFRKDWLLPLIFGV
jgi:hypothetical protein